ncbi:uncharacterized protein LOC115221679 isoform X2 [Octopus sinensis]|uniref:Uncharacterized protein LOC115221679 isoform X2 n=1 Tax=Octopus sinensis TaxID=2607531 RepID=A0A7E6FGR6_9MOLL|nr:uncharacterized protein LOC115221679 isoform X2 [Octopus sinensis]
MSCSYIIVAGGSRRPFLLTMLSTTFLVMTMIVMTSAEDSAEITSLEPKDGFKIGGRMNITCSLTTDNLLTFMLMRNSTIVVEIQYQKKAQGYVIIKKEMGFDCNLPSDNNVVKCWKNGLNCNDVAWYKCETNTAISSSKSLKVKSSIRSLREPFPPPEENQISTFTCDADVASSESSVVFRWTVNRGNNIDGVESEDRRVQVPKSSNCYTTVKSDYRYNVTIRDSSNTTITCTIFSESRSHTFSIPGRIPVTEAPVVGTAGGLDGGTIAGIVLGVIALIVLVVLLIWFFVIRKKADKPDTKPKSTGPPPTRKDYDERENAIYAKTDKMKSEPSEALTDNHVYENNKAKGSRRHHPKKGSEFLPSHGDATDQMDELDEPYPPPPPPPPPSKPNHPPPVGLQDQLHYAELQLAVEDSKSRRSKYIPRTETPYAETKQTGRANANPRNNQDIGVYTVEGKANPVMNVEDEDDGGSYSQRYAPGSAV